MCRERTTSVARSQVSFKSWAGPVTVLHLWLCMLARCCQGQHSDAASRLRGGNRSLLLPAAAAAPGPGSWARHQTTQGLAHPQSSMSEAAQPGTAAQVGFVCDQAAAAAVARAANAIARSGLGVTGRGLGQWLPSTVSMAGCGAASPRPLAARRHSAAARRRWWERRGCSTPSCTRMQSLRRTCAHTPNNNNVNNHNRA